MSSSTDPSHVSGDTNPKAEPHQATQVDGTPAPITAEWVKSIQKQLVDASEANNAGDTDKPREAFKRLDMLAKLLGLTKSGYREWVTSDLYRPMWETLLNDTISPLRKRASEGGPGFHSPTLPRVQAVLAKNLNEGVSKYADPQPDKSEWNTVDHYAFFLYQVRMQNIRDPNGVFFNKKMHVLTIDDIIWQVFRRSLQETYYNKPEKHTVAKPQKPSKRAAETTADTPKKVAKATPTVKITPKIPVNSESQVQLTPEFMRAIQAEIGKSIAKITDQVCASMAAPSLTAPVAIPSSVAQRPLPSAVNGCDVEMKDANTQEVKPQPAKQETVIPSAPVETKVDIQEKNTFHPAQASQVAPFEQVKLKEEKDDSPPVQETPVIPCEQPMVMGENSKKEVQPVRDTLAVSSGQEGEMGNKQEKETCQQAQVNPAAPCEMVGIEKDLPEKGVEQTAQEPAVTTSSPAAVQANPAQNAEKHTTEPVAEVDGVEIQNGIKPCENVGGGENGVNQPAVTALPGSNGE